MPLTRLSAQARHAGEVAAREGAEAEADGLRRELEEVSAVRDDFVARLADAEAIISEHKTARENLDSQVREMLEGKRVLFVLFFLCSSGQSNNLSTIRRPLRS